MGSVSSKSPVGINGIGRIGKLLLWLLSVKTDSEEIVVSTGRKTGKSIEDMATYLAYDSTYGTYGRFLFGYHREGGIEVRENSIYINNKRLIWLSDPSFRVPGSIPWSRYGVEVVFDTTGKMTDPSRNDENSLRGHLNHAKKVILTAPFRIKDKGNLLPDDAITLVGGVNFGMYDDGQHHIISNASCTTNCCAPAIKAMVDHFGERMISYALTTVHASTNSQSVLDVLPKENASDTRKARSILNNLIPSTTGAAKAVIEVIPEIREMGIGSQASAIRVPVNTASIVIMDVSLIGEYDNEYINSIMRTYCDRNKRVMKYSAEQLVSSDVIGSTYSAIYDSLFTHRRTSRREDRLYTIVDMNVWYDNEFGYVSSLDRLYEMITGVV